jgi:uncharacterized protein (TIGR00251 family)
MGRSTETAQQATLTFHVQPRAKKTEVVGWHGEAVKIRISAPPVDGAANAELERFVAGVAGVPRTAVQITSGATRRCKHLTVRGISTAHLLRALGVA